MYLRKLLGILLLALTIDSCTGEITEEKPANVLFIFTAIMVLGVL